MRTKDVRVNKIYLCDGTEVIVREKIKGRRTRNRNMQSGVLFTGNHRMKSKFLLSNGKTVYADKLTENTK